MKTSKSILSGSILAAVTALSLGACTYHERTVVERPVATAPSTVVVPDSRPNTVVVPESRPNTVVVPEGSSVVVPPSN
ncbi:MAG: hypothetical protein ACYCZX_20090 [Rhodospirillaceae bacterium]